MATFFKSSWGSVELWLSEIETDDGRSLVIQSYTRGDTPDVQNRGGRPKLARCTLLFDDIVGAKQSGRDRLQSMIDLKNAGRPQLFVHPFYGAYLAEIDDFSWKVDEHSVISGTCSFVAVEDTGTVIADPVGVSGDFDTNAIATATANLQTELTNVGLPSGTIPNVPNAGTLPRGFSSQVPSLANALSTVFDNANGAVDAFGNKLATARDVFVAVGSITETISNEIDALQAATDVLLWPLFKAYIAVSDAARAAGAAVAPSNLMTIVVNAPTSLRRLLWDLYGQVSNVDIESLIVEAEELNDIRTPARIAPGTSLTLRRPTSV